MSATTVEAQSAQRCENGRLIDASGRDIGPCPSEPLSRNGVFGCTGRGANVSNPGLLAIQGGIYVPVNDSAVTLNTGYLVYKECVLDGVVKRSAESASVQIAVQVTRSVTTGRDGRTKFGENDYTETLEIKLAQLPRALSDENIDTMCPAFRNQVRNGELRTELLIMNRPKDNYKCTLPENPNASIWDRLSAYREFQNNALGARLILAGQIASTNGFIEENYRDIMNRNRGFLNETDRPDDPLNSRILTPGYVIAESYQQILGSGFRQLENATEIDQIVGNLWSGMQAQILGGNGGLIGLLQNISGSGSYLSRMASESAQGVRDAAVNAAIAVLNGALAAERTYRQAKEAVANAILNAIAKLRAAEAQCWDLIIPKVQERAAQDNASITIATSTEASQSIITSQITPIASTTANDIRASENAVLLLNAIATALVNSSNPAMQQQAILQLEQLLQTNQIHSAQDAQTAISQRDTILQALNVLVDDTIKAWGDSTDPNIGWCNINNPAVIDKWYMAWRN